MKLNLAKVSLALLGAVFVLGCQDVGSGPVGPDGLEPQFAKGGGHGKPDGGETTIFQVTFPTVSTTHFSATDPTLTTTAPTTVNHKLWGIIFSNAWDGIKLGDIELRRVAVYPRMKAGKVTSVAIHFNDSNIVGSGTAYHTGRLPVDPPEPVSGVFTLHLHANSVELRESQNSPSIGTVSIADAVYTPVP